MCNPKRLIQNSNLCFNSVLHVPGLDCNLLSISKLTSDLACVAKFYPKSCIFQDLELGRTIDSADLCSGLYVLNYNSDGRLALQTSHFLFLVVSFLLVSINIVICCCTISWVIQIFSLNYIKRFSMLRILRYSIVRLSSCQELRQMGILRD